MAETKSAAEYISVVKTVNEVQFLGFSGKQISSNMAGGLDIKEVPKGIQFTSRAWPGKRIVVYHANIAHVEFKEVEQ